MRHLFRKARWCFSRVHCAWLQQLVGQVAVAGSFESQSIPGFLSSYKYSGARLEKSDMYWKPRLTHASFMFVLLHTGIPLELATR